MSENIPNDVLAAARAVEIDADFTWDSQTTGVEEKRETVENIARAIMAERLSAQAAQREKDAQFADLIRRCLEAGRKRPLSQIDEHVASVADRIAAAIRNQSHAPDPQAIAGADLCPRETPASKSTVAVTDAP